MKRITLAVALISALPALAQEPAVDKLARGKYLVTTSGCNDCHTPWVLGPKGPEPPARGS
jgi:mono/diheme cytochrome c family protein